MLNCGAFAPGAVHAIAPRAQACPLASVSHVMHGVLHARRVRSSPGVAWTLVMGLHDAVFTAWAFVVTRFTQTDGGNPLQLVGTLCVIA